MPSLVITVTSEVIQHANDIIQKGRGHMVLAHREGRWELVSQSEFTLVAKDRPVQYATNDPKDNALGPNKVWDPPVHGAILRSNGGGTDGTTE